MTYLLRSAEVAELVDALDSKSSSLSGVRVRAPPSVPIYRGSVAGGSDMPEEGARQSLPGRGVLATLLISLVFCAPLAMNLSGLRQGDAFRDEDWLHDISFSFYLKEGLLTHQEFPLRTHLVGGGYPILGHPSDGTMSPFSLPFLLLSPEIAVRVNLLVLLWLGTLGIYGLARKELHLSDGPALVAAAAFAFSGWFPSFMLAGFYVQAFYLLSPLILYLLLSPGHTLRSSLLAGLLLCPVLFQAGTGLAAVAHFLAVASFLLCSVRDSPDGSRPVVRGLLGLASVIVLSALVAHHAQWGVVLSGLMSALFVAAAMLWLPTRALLVAWKPALLRLLICLSVMAAVGAGKWVSVQDLLSRSDYLEEYLPTQQARDDGEQGYHYQFGTPMEAEHSFYDGIPSLLHNFQFSLERETAYRDESPIHPEYAPLGLTLPIVALALLAAALQRRGLGLLLIFGVYLAVCMGPNLPLDPYRNLVWGLPGFYSLNQPYKYFNFFLVVPVALLFGLAADLASRKTGRERAVLGGAAVILLWPLVQNASLFVTLTQEPAVIGERPDEFHQVSRPRQLDPDSPDRFGDVADLDRSDREHNRNDDTREFFNVPRGIGLVDWYADIYLDEYAWARHFVRRDGSRVDNPAYPGEAWCTAGACTISRVQMTMNTIAVTLHSSAPDRLIVNQNYDGDFVSQHGPVLEQDGLLAIDLTQAGAHEILFDFRPPHILWALRVSAVSLLLVLIGLGLTFRRRER
jgi:hypothetical protein